MRLATLVVVIGVSLASAALGQSRGAGPYQPLLEDDSSQERDGLSERERGGRSGDRGDRSLFRAPLSGVQRPALRSSQRDDFGDNGEAEQPQDKDAAIGMYLRDLAHLQPGEYGEREKLLESLQLERIASLRNVIEGARALDGDRSASQVRDETQRAVAQRTSVWPSATIAVSWDVTAADYSRYARERQLVRAAVQATWERESAVRFTGWGRSTANNVPGIRIAIRDEGPHCKALGRNLDGRRAGMVLNFSFNNWCPQCGVNRNNSIQYIAVHEFGHALGLAHEQNRSDAPSWCRAEQQGSDGDWRITIYDPQSIMNYCSDRWNNDGKLTALDKRAIRLMYGNPRSSSNTAWDGEAPFGKPWQGLGGDEGDQGGGDDGYMDDEDGGYGPGKGLGGRYDEEGFDDSGYGDDYPDDEMQDKDDASYQDDERFGFERKTGPVEVSTAAATGSGCGCGVAKVNGQVPTTPWVAGK